MNNIHENERILKEILDKMMDNCISIVDLIEGSNRYGYITSDRMNKIIEAINDYRR